VARNLQRARDHGVPGYNAYRQVNCNISARDYGVPVYNAYMQVNCNLSIIYFRPL
jgi:Animal haem peroxidase